MKDLTLLMQRIGYTFQNQALLVNALTHSSYAHEHHRNEKDNERLEFLGDAVLGFVCAEYLFSLLSSQEGELTKVRASVVCEKALASYANALELGDFLLLGHGEQRFELGGAPVCREQEALAVEALEDLLVELGRLG